MKHHSQIVADGRQRNLDSSLYQEKLREKILLIDEKYASELVSTAWPKRIIVYFRR